MGSIGPQTLLVSLFAQRILYDMERCKRSRIAFASRRTECNFSYISRTQHKAQQQSPHGCAAAAAAASPSVLHSRSGIIKINCNTFTLHDCAKSNARARIAHRNIVRHTTTRRRRGASELLLMHNTAILHRHTQTCRHFTHTRVAFTVMCSR